MLYEANPIIYGVWDYLIHVKAEEMRRLPAHVPHIDELKGIPEEAKWFIGFWFGGPTLLPLARDKYFKEDPEKKGSWNSRVIDRISCQVDKIRHWRVYHKSYVDGVYSGKAAWFIDPPYQGSLGKLYKNVPPMDFNHLREWTLARKGQVIVCEGAEADWLPFKVLMETKRSAEFGTAGKKTNVQMIWTKNCPDPKKKGFGISC